MRLYSELANGEDRSPDSPDHRLSNEDD